ncbi:MAG: cyoE [Bacteroidetes bacterium]|jgi:protoheme IX farnesyltransferase|nr:cyoE [Bacteroidota bacterium]
MLNLYGENLHKFVPLRPQMNEKAEITIEQVSYSKVAAFVKLTKMRLSLLVVFSAVVSYFTINPHNFDWQHIIALSFGGFLVTACANSYNQVIEKKLDKLMKRTQNRPLPLEILTPSEAIIFATICGVVGCWLLFTYTNALCGILSVSSIILYALVYTPLKRVTPFSVFVGAIPGALPTLIGALAGGEGFGTFSMYPLLLYCIQFFWQFPHFWAIAWVSHDDYQRAGFFMLPSMGGRDMGSRFQILIYTLFLIPISLTPYFFGFAGLWGSVVVLLLGINFLMQAYRLYKDGEIKSARRLMFGSFYYLPVVQLALMIGY